MTLGGSHLILLVDMRQHLCYNTDVIKKVVVIMDERLMKLYAHRLMWMDKYIKEHVADEDLIDCWLENGVPDGCDEESCEEIVDTEFYVDCCKLFAYILYENDL